MEYWIEEEIFRKSQADFSLLMDYGFQVEEKKLTYSKNIMNDDFEVVVTFTDHFEAAVYDLSFDEHEEYLGYRVKYNAGEYASRVRFEVEELLTDIKEKCCKETKYLSAQTERIVQYIFDKYGDLPDLQWAGADSPPAFRNPENRKWYGLLMSVERSKVMDGNGMVELLNLKLDPLEILELVEKKGFFPAFHMNKKNWISVILDDTLKDEEIYPYIEESHRFTVKQKLEMNYWITPANPGIYDLRAAFAESPYIHWNQSSNVNKGDIVYIYVGKPIGALKYACKVLKPDIYYGDSHNERLMKLRLIRVYKDDYCPKSKLVEYGVTNIRGPRHCPEKLVEYLEKNV